MWFKNLQLYRLLKPFSSTGEQLHEQLSGEQFRSCGTLESFTYGWVPPLGRHGQLLTHSSESCIMICARKEERVLPAAVVREALDERVSAIEEAEGRPVRSKERQGLKDDLTFELLPRAFTRSSFTYAYLDTREGWLVVDSASAKRAEELVSLLRQTLGSFPTMRPVTQQSPEAIMSSWLLEQQSPTGFTVGDECELRDALKEGGVIRCRNQDLGADEVINHLKAGKRVVKLALEDERGISLLVDEELAIKRLRFADLLTEESMEAHDETDRFDAEFAIMSQEIRGMVARLLEQFGGENREAYGFTP